MSKYIRNMCRRIPSACVHCWIDLTCAKPRLTLLQRSLVFFWFTTMTSAHCSCKLGEDDGGEHGRKDRQTVSPYIFSINYAVTGSIVCACWPSNCRSSVRQTVWWFLRDDDDDDRRDRIGPTDWPVSSRAPFSDGQSVIASVSRRPTTCIL